MQSVCPSWTSSPSSTKGSLVGDAARPMIGRVIADEFSAARDWPMASSVAVALLVLMVGPMMAYSHFQARTEPREARP